MRFPADGLRPGSVGFLPGGNLGLPPRTGGSAPPGLGLGADVVLDTGFGTGGDVACGASRDVTLGGGADVTFVTLGGGGVGSSGSSGGGGGRSSVSSVALVRLDADVRNRACIVATGDASFATGAAEAGAATATAGSGIFSAERTTSQIDDTDAMAPIPVSPHASVLLMGAICEGTAAVAAVAAAAVAAAAGGGGRRAAGINVRTALKPMHSKGPGWDTTDGSYRGRRFRTRPTDLPVPPGLEGCERGSGDWVGPHVGVHGRADPDRLAEVPGPGGAADQVVAHPRRQLACKIEGSREHLTKRWPV